MPPRLFVGREVRQAGLLDLATRSGTIAVCACTGLLAHPDEDRGKVLCDDRLVFCMGGLWRVSESSFSTSKPSSTRSVIACRGGGRSSRASCSASPPVCLLHCCWANKLTLGQVEEATYDCKT